MNRCRPRENPQFFVDSCGQMSCPRLDTRHPRPGMADAVSLSPALRQSGAGVVHSGAAISASASAGAFGTARS
jgi:hypothetical protein